MKTIEQKAKAYDEALEKAKDMLSYKEVRKEDIEYLFPELVESEDERIRKELIEHIKANQETDYVLFQKFSPEDVIAWLEKQKSVGEIVERCKKSWYNEGKIDGKFEGIADDVKYQQGWHDALEKQGEKTQGKTAFEAIKEKPADNANKVEPKFKVGDWVVWENQYYKVNYNGCGYELVGQNGLNTSLEYGTVDENAHHWDIAKDAKDGDILSNGQMVVIFKCFEEPAYRENIVAYIGLDSIGNIQVTDYAWYLGTDRAHPATKEQRDLLFQKMRKAGYEWDAEKKGLKLLITNGGDF